MPLFNFLIAGDERSMIDFDFRGKGGHIVLSIQDRDLPVLDHGEHSMKLPYGRVGPEKTNDTKQMKRVPSGTHRTMI